MSSDTGGSPRRVFFREAISLALREEMERDEAIILMGQDIGRFGGSYKEFQGLSNQFGPARVRDTPVAEQVMVGVGVGAAAAGLKPLVSITYMDFLMLGLDPLVNYAAKARYKTGGQITVPLVVKTTAGSKGQGVAHSQCIEAWLMSVPGLRVVAPSNPADAYRLMKTALRCDGPVVYIDHKRLFPRAGVLPEPDGAPLDFGQAAIMRSGTDVTITTHAYMTIIALEAAVQLQDEGVSCEVIDLRSLAPLDVKTICRSVQNTGALLTLEEGQLICGVGAEVAAQVQELMGPILTYRVGSQPAPVSSNPVLEAECLPNAERVVSAVRQLLSKRLLR